MNEPSLADRTFHIIMRRMVETGQVPHFTEIAADLFAKSISNHQRWSTEMVCPMSFRVAGSLLAFPT